ncbi:hypothetical protein BDQ94DRAFT_136655 [Aspergillus welwitschiae]|uniref:Uncharacterized protein n=1 Tax=Aspergillus welwitschiae TaxID=1341132 RepID=A0A3F3QE73_9EURO|nr:hypothetical protein BDQ94DRAFT_136655 [Aspergillus welwitschiae]RDH37568.1 hypothetical protein BDQ94DRAFT_136655 [Aspergillus welwitschiae]
MDGFWSPATPSISFGTSPPGLPRRNIHLSFYHIPMGVILHRGVRGSSPDDERSWFYHFRVIIGVT